MWCIGLVADIGSLAVIGPDWSAIFQRSVKRYDSKIATQILLFKVRLNTIGFRDCMTLASVNKSDLISTTRTMLRGDYFLGEFMGITKGVAHVFVIGRSLESWRETRLMHIVFDVHMRQSSEKVWHF